MARLHSPASRLFWKAPRGYSLECHKNVIRLQLLKPYSEVQQVDATGERDHFNV
jgi:hypothetical protein